jgi:flagellar motor switch protein FliG
MATTSTAISTTEAPPAEATPTEVAESESLAVAIPRLPGIKKAAILMVALGEQTSTEVMKLLDEDEVAMLSREIARSGAVLPDIAQSVLEEAYQMSMAQDYVLKGGLEYAKRLLNNSLGPDSAKRVVDRLVKLIGTDSTSFASLQKADPQQLAKFIHNEHPQTIALILSHLNPGQAAALLSSLPQELRAEVTHRMANLDEISPEIVGRIAQIVGQKLKSLGELSREAYGGVRAVTEVLNRLDANASKEILESIEREDPNLVETIRQLMFTFDDLMKVDEAGIKELLTRLDRKILTLSLKGTSEKLKERFLSNMSARGAEMMREDMEAMGPVRIRDVEGAQQQVIAMIRQMEAEGVINLKGGAGEQYVN